MRAAHPTTLLTCIGGPEPMELERADCTERSRCAQRHDTFTIGVIERGIAPVRYRGQVETHRPGGVIVIAPGEVHAYGPPSSAGWSHRIVRPSAALLRRLARLPEVPALATARTPSFARSWYADAELAGRLAAAHAVLEAAARLQPDRAPSLVESLLADVLTTLVRRHALADTHALAARSDDGVARRAVQRVIDFLDAHLGERVCLARLAEVAGMGPFTLIRCFRRIVGVPPYAYLELLRVERAKQLLRSGVAITDVAYTTGFSDQSHLTRHFRRVVGVPPGQYARAHAAGMGRRVA